VESVPESLYGEATLARGLPELEWVGPRAIAHERVIESFLSAPALLPMQLFTLFTSDQRVIDHVRSDRTRIARILKRVEGKVEFGVRLTWNEKAVRDEAASKPARTGAEFLARKRDMLDVTRTRLGEARKAADRIYKSIAKQASASQRRTTMEQAAAGSRLLLDAAFLVTTRNRSGFKAAISQNTRELRGAGVDIVVSGPWPPYNFIQ
jgi:hypothetical protein